MLGTRHNEEVFAAAAIVVVVIIIIIAKDSKLKTTVLSKQEKPLLSRSCQLSPGGKLRARRSALPSFPNVQKKPEIQILCDIC